MNSPLKTTKGYLEDPNTEEVMNDAAGHHKFVKASAAQLVDHLKQATPEVKAAVTAATGAQTDAEIEQHRMQLLADFTKVRDKAYEEVPEPYVHYVSRIEVVGLYQSVL